MIIRTLLLSLFSAVFLMWAAPNARACTIITVGKKATSDGSVITTHTVDSHNTSSAITVTPPKKHKTGSMLKMTKRKKIDAPMERLEREDIGVIPQVAATFGYLSPAYAPMNEHQLAIGESTFGGREELRSENGLIDCESLQKLMMERAKTAREAIRIGGELIEKYGWIDEGEALSIVDKHEAWVMEIVGPGKDKRGAIWAAKRIPDDHVAVFANASRIRQIDMKNAEQFMASKNVITDATKAGYWSEDSGKPFEFCYAYDPDGRRSVSSTRREWRVFSLLAPSQKFHPNAENYPFSIKPDKPVSVAQIMAIFRDTYEGTDYDMVKDLTVTDKNGKTVKSPVANPFMPYDMNKMLKINGGWGWRGERSLARWYTMYATITQSRSGLPNPIGGLVWFGYDNTAMTTWMPIYVGVTDLPDDFKTDGRETGYSRKNAWWAFNRVATIAAHRWGEMRHDIGQVRYELQTQLFDNQKKVEEDASKLYKKSPKKARRYLTKYVKKACNSVVKSYWALGDMLWTKYDEQW